MKSNPAHRRGLDYKRDSCLRKNATEYPFVIEMVHDASGGVLLSLACYNNYKRPHAMGSMFRVKTKILLLAVLGFAALATCVASLLTSVTRVPSVGIVKAVGVGVYWDENCTSRVTEIDWGFIEPGGLVNVMIFLRKEGNAPIVLSISTENWDPPNASEYITLSWDYAGQTVNPGTVLKINLTLAVSSNVTGIMNFTFDIVIAGIE